VNDLSTKEQKQQLLLLLLLLQRKSSNCTTPEIPPLKSRTSGCERPVYKEQTAAAATAAAS